MCGSHFPPQELVNDVGAHNSRARAILQAEALKNRAARRLILRTYLQTNDLWRRKKFAPEFRVWKFSAPEEATPLRHA
jgi:hypothetical protein